MEPLITKDGHRIGIPMSLKGNPEFLLSIVQVIKGNQDKCSSLVRFIEAPQGDSKFKKFYAVFTSEEADFELMVNNAGQRRAELELKTNLHPCQCFIYESGKKYLQRTLDFNDDGADQRKLRFVSQRLKCARSRVAAYAKRHVLPLELASEAVSQIHASFWVEKPEECGLNERKGCVNIGETMTIHVTDPDGGVHVVMIGRQNTLKDLKIKIFQLAGIELHHQKLLYHSVPLTNDTKTLMELNIKNGTTIKCTTENKGGLRFGRRGALMAGEKTTQIFESTQFTRDETFIVKPFIIELRLDSTYEE